MTSLAEQGAAAHRYAVDAALAAMAATDPTAARVAARRALAKVPVALILKVAAELALSAGRRPDVDQSAIAAARAHAGEDG